MSLKRETFLAQIGNRKEEHVGAINTPIYLSTAYRHEGIGLNKGYDYTRTGNPTRQILEEAIAELEKGDRGFACSSGMSAILLVFSLFKSGDHIIASRDLYGGSFRLFEFIEKQQGITFSYWEEENETLDGLITEQTKAIFIETPTNPLMKETDLTAIHQVAKKHNLIFIVDNTFYTPYIQRPIEDGADIVIHSATKYLGGHNDVLGGLVVSKGEEIGEQLFHYHNGAGAVLSPFDSWLLMRGLKTLALRMRQHEQNAKAVVQFLNNHDAVERVYYAGRGGMVSFDLKNDQWVSTFLRSIELFVFAESLGGVESFITYPSTQTHMDIPKEVREEYGLTDKLLRISVGIEHAEDLIADLDQALKKCVAVQTL